LEKIKDSTASLQIRSFKLLKKGSASLPDISSMSQETLIEELRVHQIELELQNEELHLAREISDRLQAKYINLYEFAPVGYLTLGENAQILEANLTAVNLLGVNKSEILNSPFSNFIDTDYQDILYFYMLKLRKSKVNESCEIKLKKRGEKSFYAHLESMAICSQDNGRNEIRISFININENKLISIALKESSDRNEMLLNLLPHSAFLIDKDRKVIVANRMAKISGVTIGQCCDKESPVGASFDIAHDKDLLNISCVLDDNPYQQRLFTVINDSNDAVCLMDLKGNIKSWNRMAEAMYGYTAADAVTKTIFDLVPARLKQQTVNLLNDISSGVLVKPFETKRIAKDGNVLDICLTVTRMIQDGKIIAIATTERDITNHNRLFASLQDLPRRIIMAQENERSRISQILHGEFGQSLIALKLLTSISAADLPAEDHLMRSIFSRIGTQLDIIINDTRTLAHKLSPPGLKYVGLIPAIKELVESAMKDKIKIQFFYNDTKESCFKEKDIIIYRILQEALQNISKHSKANRARVTIVFKKTVFILEVRDNGIGFDQSLESSSKGLGLALMKHQATLVCGKLSIKSRKGKGTTLKVTIPIKEKKFI